MIWGKRSMSPASALFVGNNPGGVRAFLPVYRELPGARLALSTPVLSLAQGAQGAEGAEPIALNTEMTHEDISFVLDRIRPSVLVTGTSVPNSAGGHLEGLFRREAKKRKIPSVAILDHWCHYRERFREGEDLVLPDKICVMDERARMEMLEAGFPADAVSVTGQPAFDALFRDVFPRRETWRLKGRNELGLEDGRIAIGFLSEPITGDYGAVRGYTEFDVLENLLDLCASSHGRELLIKLHPREPADKYEPLLKKYSFRARVLAGSFDIQTFLVSMDGLIGMTSVALLQAALLGQPALSFQPGPPDNPLSKAVHPVPVVRDTAPVGAFFKNPAAERIHNFYSEPNATANVLKTIRLEQRGARS